MEGSHSFSLKFHPSKLQHQDSTSTSGVTTLRQCLQAYYNPGETRLWALIFCTDGLGGLAKCLLLKPK